MNLRARSEFKYCSQCEGVCTHTSTVKDAKVMMPWKHAIVGIQKKTPSIDCSAYIAYQTNVAHVEA
jgi:hypothetical protein